MSGVSPISSSVPRPVEYVFTNGNEEAFFCRTYSSVHASRSTPVLLCVHGAGMSGDCFARLARELQKSSDKPAADSSNATTAQASSLMTVGASPALSATALLALPSQSEVDSEDLDMHIITFDLRCHGQSTFAGGEENLKMEVLRCDFLDILEYAKTTLFPESNFFVLGHSLGGAIVARALNGNKVALQRISGVLIVDIVEGTAQLSLQHMAAFLKTRPTSFSTVEDAVTWFLRMGGMHSAEGAHTSVPPLLRLDPESGLWEWRTDLSKMASVWGEWFSGLDDAFVSLPCAKMLCTANTERLDKTLMVAQMQGKFQFEVMGNGCGHYVMDDATANFAAKVRRFVRRNEILTQKLRFVNQRLSSHTGQGVA